MIFNSFFMGGYECADHINRSGERVNLLLETAHDVYAAEDFSSLSMLGIKTVREGICWSLIEKVPYQYDFSEVENRIKAAGKLGMTAIWDMCHFGYPDGLYPTHPHFCDRFTALCAAFAKYYTALTDLPLYVIPINEISFLSWHSGDVRGTVPFAVNSGFDMKYHLCKAAISGLKALKENAPGCRVIWVEPLIKIHGTEAHDPELLHRLNEDQFQAMDIIAGRMCPELGGSEDYLDILGFNYYWNCQWVHEVGPLPWPEITSLRTPLHQLLLEASARYGKPVFVSETGHFGEGRAQWLDEVTTECIKAMEKGLDLMGICIYPVTDRPDWDNLEMYSNCGIWDLDDNKGRIPCGETVAMVRQCVARTDEYLSRSIRSAALEELLHLSEKLEPVINEGYETL